MLEKLIAVATSTTRRWALGTSAVIRSWIRPPSETVLKGIVLDAIRTRPELIAENALLREQWVVACRGSKRPVFRDRDRLLMVLFASVNSAWRRALLLVQPDTLLRWHRDSSLWSAFHAPSAR